MQVMDTIAYLRKLNFIYLYGVLLVTMISSVVGAFFVLNYNYLQLFLFFVVIDLLILLPGMSRFIKYNSSLSAVYSLGDVFEEFTMRYNLLLGKYKKSDKIFLIYDSSLRGSTYYLFGFHNYFEIHQAENFKYIRNFKKYKTADAQNIIKFQNIVIYRASDHFIIPTPNGIIEGEGLEYAFSGRPIVLQSGETISSTFEKICEKLKNEIEVVPK